MIKKTQTLIAHDGQYIVLPPGMAGQELSCLDAPNVLMADSAQKYPLGTKFVNGDRVYHYAKASGTVHTYWGAYKPKKTNTVAAAPIQAAGAGLAGSYYVTVTIDTEIGVLTTGVLSANELAGGYIVIGNGSNQDPQMCLIVSHPALATAGGSLTLKLDMPLAIVVTAAITTIELMECPFYNLKADGSGGQYVTYIGMPAATASSGQYFWVQTWGPCWITSDGNTCDSVDDREIFFVGNGSVKSGGTLTYQGSAYQRAGVALDMSGSAASNAPFVLLQIMP